MHGESIPYGYGFWSLVVVNAAIFVLFALSFLAPVRRREWRSFGVFTAFVVALFTEMYGFPLTIYVLTAILGSRYPALNPFSHASGHLWITLLGGGPWMSAVIHLVSNGLMLAGLLLMGVGWYRIHRARGELVTDGVYAWVRHPQYAGLFLITVGMLIQWPTIVTVLTWPALMLVYYRLARREEREAEARFGDAYARWKASVPMFVPRIGFGRGAAPSAVERLDPEALSFAVLRGLAMIGGLAALSIAPLRPEHQVHLAPLLGAFIAYKALLFALLFFRPAGARPIFLATLGADLGIVFVLVWFTGGGESHFYLLFSVLVALNAYHFGPGIGVLAAILSADLMAVANILVAPGVPWAHIGARAALFGFLGLALGHIASRERRARAEAEGFNAELRAALARLEEAKDRAVRAERLAAAGRVSARMAHEVRSPISAIGLNVEMLEEIVRGCPGPMMGDAGDLLRGIRAEVRRLAGLTDEYLTFSRLPRAQPQEDSINEMLDELVAFVKPEADQRGVVLVRDPDPLIPLFSFDRDLLRRAVLNLVKNGIEATPQGGWVLLATRLDGDRTEVSVEDTGRGIDARDAPHLFEPFFTTKPRGTGLGLAIARQIAEEHGGTLAWSNACGGARFTLRLPLKGAGHE